MAYEAHGQRPRMQKNPSSRRGTLERTAARARAKQARALIAPALALIVWLVSLQRVDLRQMNDLGLVSVLPPTIYVAFAILIIVFGLEVRKRQPRVALLLICTATLIVMLFGMTAVVEEMPRFAAAWKHVGFIEYITRTGRVAPELDARFSWPGFFILAGLLTQVAGLQSALPFVAWAPVAFNLLYLAPLFIILRSLAEDGRVAWLGVWLFYVANWIGQDYFGPQAFAYLLYLIVLAIVLHWFKTTVGPPALAVPRPGTAPFGVRLRYWMHHFLAPAATPNAPSQPWQRVALQAILVVLLAVISASHQLTPFFTLVALTLLVVFNRCTLRTLPLLSAVLTASWIAFMAWTFMSGHIEMVLGSIGEISGTVDANVSGRMQGSGQHMAIVYLRMGMSALIWALALVGALRRLLSGHWDLTPALLAVAPFPLLALQDYGGEMMLRIYLFALPFMVFYIATLVFPTPEAGGSGRSVVAVCLVSALLFALFMFARFGNERADWMTKPEVDAVNYLYRIASRGSLFVSVTSNMPWKQQDCEGYCYLLVPNERLTDDPDGLARKMQDWEECGGAYVILTRSQKAAVEMFEYPPQSWDRFVQNIRASHRFRQIFANEDASIWVVIHQEG